MNRDPAIDVDISHVQGDFRLEAAFTAPRGITALFGHSGAGKTTLVDILAGLRRPSRGYVSVGGKRLSDEVAGIFLPPERRRIGYVFQDGRLFPHLNVRGNLRYGYRAEHERSPALEFDAVVGLLELESHLSRRPNSLSGGEKQRVALGRALLSAPRLLLMDEPLSALDRASKDEVLPYIERLRDHAGLPIVYVSHSLDEVVRLADTMVLLSEGRVIAHGELTRIMSRLDLRPYTGRHAGGSVLNAIILRHAHHDQLSALGVGCCRLWVPMLDEPPGTCMKIRIRARDVIIALDAPWGTSAVNVLPATVARIEAGTGPFADVLLDIGEPLIATITRRALNELNLHPGQDVFAVIDPTAIDRRSILASSTGAGMKPSVLDLVAVDDNIEPFPRTPASEPGRGAVINER